MEHSQTAGVRAQTVRVWVKEYCENGTFNEHARLYKKRLTLSLHRRRRHNIELRQWSDERLFFSEEKQHRLSRHYCVSHVRPICWSRRR